MVVISLDQQRAIPEAGDRPVPIVDPETNQTYLITKSEVFERLRAAPEEEEIDPSFLEIDDFEPTGDDSL
jgi:hypothetical protein